MEGSDKLHSIQHGEYKAVSWWCPGCECMHMVPIEGPYAWKFDGNFETPTLSPSILVTYSYGNPPEKHRCHSHMRNGIIEFLSDCTHSLASKKIPINDS